MCSAGSDDAREDQCIHVWRLYLPLPFSLNIVVPPSIRPAVVVDKEEEDVGVWCSCCNGGDAAASRMACRFGRQRCCIIYRLGTDKEDRPRDRGGGGMGTGREW